MSPRKHGRDPIAVIDPQGRYFSSATSAAFANLVRPSTALANAKLGRNGWRLAEPETKAAGEEHRNG